MTNDGRLSLILALSGWLAMAVICLATVVVNRNNNPVRMGPHHITFDVGLDELERVHVRYRDGTEFKWGEQK